MYSIFVLRAGLFVESRIGLGSISKPCKHVGVGSRTELNFHMSDVGHLRSSMGVSTAMGFSMMSLSTATSSQQSYGWTFGEKNVNVYELGKIVNNIKLNNSSNVILVNKYGGGRGIGPRKPLNYWQRNQSTQSRRYVFLMVFFGIVIVVVLSRLDRSPTGRVRLIVTPKAAEKAAADEMFNQLREQYRSQLLPSWHPITQRVTKVTRNIIASSGVEAFKDYNWEVVAINSPIQNAFCMPGGKIVIFTGIIALCEDENELAVVLSHEIAHAYARHGAEKMAVSFLISTIALAVALTFGISIGSLDMVNRLALELPYSRKLELEADRIGLTLMAKACYNPTAALHFWEKMGNKDGPRIDLLSTHPSSKKRVEKLQEYQKEAIEKMPEHCLTVGKYFKRLHNY